MPYKDKEKQREYFRIYNANRKDKTREYNKIYNEINKDTIRAKQKIYCKAYYALNKDHERERGKSYRDSHKELVRERAKIYLDSHQEWIGAYRRTTGRFSKYGITPDEYDRMFNIQGGVCAICGNPETSKTNGGGATRQLAIDHDHETGKVRGLLCNRCNRMIGYAKDNELALESAANYIRKYKYDNV